MSINILHTHYDKLRSKFENMHFNIKKLRCFPCNFFLISDAYFEIVQKKEMNYRYRVENYVPPLFSKRKAQENFPCAKWEFENKGKMGDFEEQRE